MDDNQLEINKAYVIAFKPLSLVVHSNGAIGLVQTVSINECQQTLEHILSYAVHWMFNPGNLKYAWFRHDDLDCLGDITTALAEMAHGAHKMSDTKRLMGDDNG